MTLGSHQTTVGKSQVHITPKWIIDALGPFDLDPCAADPRPWDCAKQNITEAGWVAFPSAEWCEPIRGLDFEWPRDLLVWLNPPFDRYEVDKWIAKLALHGNGIALLHARTETEWFRPCWEYAAAILFMDRRISFCRPDGSEQPANSGAPPVLVAFGEAAYRRLMDSRIAGMMVTDWYIRNFGDTAAFPTRRSAP